MTPRTEEVGLEPRVPRRVGIYVGDDVTLVITHRYQRQDLQRSPAEVGSAVLADGMSDAMSVIHARSVSYLGSLLRPSRAATRD